ncbi:MAG TPA: DUF1176 domain-containing protein [Xanthobacteraceae bacterium]|nr:DUF1176 domain-containing protein [Xanthobacteraceae bacterium]
MKFSIAVVAFSCAVIIASAARAEQVDPAVPKNLIVEGLKKAECDVPLDDAVASADVASLGGRLKLVTISCWRAAYNFGSILFALDPAAPGKARQLRFQIYAQKKFMQSYQLSNADYDERTRMLGSFHKGSGVGDCGSIGEWKWTGANFKLTGWWFKEDCDGEPFDSDDKTWRVYPPKR